MHQDGMDLTTGKIGGRLLRFALPIMLSNLLQQMFNTVDSIVVGRAAGSTALAAVGSCGTLINLLTGLFLGLSVGAGVIYAAFCGAGNRWEQKRTADSAVFIGAVGGGLLMLVTEWIAPWLLGVVHTPEEVMAPALTYMRIYFVGMIPVLVYNIGAGLLRAGGDSQRPLLYLTAAGLINALLDVLFVCILDWGAAGAAWATVISQTAAAVITLIRLKKSLPAGGRWLETDRALSLRILRLSIPCGLQSCMFSLSNVIIQAQINAFGAAAMAGCAAFMKLDSFTFTPTQAIAAAATTFTAQNLGAGKTERIKPCVRIGLAISLASSLVLCALMLVFGRPLLGIFTSDETAIAYGMRQLWAMIPFSTIFTISDYLAGVMKGGGATVEVMAITAIFVCVIRLVWVWIMVPVLRDVSAVFYSYPVSWIPCTAVMTLYYLRGKWIKDCVTSAA